MNKDAIAKLIEECETDLRAGRISRAGNRLGSLNTAKIPRESLATVANLAWRAGLNSFGLKVLHPVMHPGKKRSALPPSDAERAEYGTLLLRAGAAKEAIRILEGVDGRKLPEAKLYQAFSHFALWEHARAVPLLEQFVAQNIPDYRKLVGRVNLAAALVAAESFDRAIEVLDRAIADAEGGGHVRLHGNCLEIRSQIHLQRRHFAKARADLNAAAERLSRIETYDQLFVRKWRALLDGLEAMDVAPIRAFRAEAASRNEWESVREADRFELLVGFDEQTFLRLLFGTPSEAYRARLLRDHPKAQVPRSYLIGDASGGILDIASARLEPLDAKSPLKPGSRNHQLLEVLCRDQYRPLRLGALHAELFPGEHFNIYSSPGLVHAWIFRTRAWLTENALPIEIEEHKRSYKLALRGELAIRLPLKSARPETEDVLWNVIVAKFGSEPFRSRDAVAAIGKSKSSTHRLLQWAIENEKAEVVKHGGEVRYGVISLAPGRKAA